jgi:nucleoid DNA-binding protein
MKDPILRSDRPSPLSAKETGPLAERLAHASGVKPAFMRKFIKEVIAVIEEGLLRHGEVKIHNFGTFRLSQPQMPAGINAKIGKPARVPERPQVVFQPSKHLRGLVNLSLGSTVPPGSRISLRALLEKHLPISAPSMSEEPTPEFDIVETFPIAEGMDERGEHDLAWRAASKQGKFLPKEQDFDFEDKPVTSSPTFVMAESGAETELAMDELKLGEAISEPASDTLPAFTFAEPAKETAPTFSQIEGQEEPLRPVISRRRSRRFAWYASAGAVFLLLLLFLLSGRISEKSESASSRPAPSSTSAPAQVAEQTSLQNGVKQSVAEQEQADKPLSKPSYESAAYFSGGTHHVVAGENLWGISGTYYRDHYLWPNIYRANTATVRNPDILQIDQSLAVPALYGPPEKLTAADRRNLAEGYFLLYRYYKENASSLAPYALWAAVQYDAAIKAEHAPELSEDDLAFLQAHGVRRVVAER